MSEPDKPVTESELREVVKEKYGQAALRVKTGASSCCGATSASSDCADPITTNL
jgi:arsenite methyltransferase